MSSLNSRVPRYVQVIEYIENKITQGYWGPQHRIPSEDELSAQFSFARGTIRQALNELVSSGLIYRVHGVGTFVGPLKHDVSGQKWRSFLDEFIDKHIDFHTVLIGSEITDPSEDMRKMIAFPEDSSKVLTVKRARIAGGECFMYSENNIPLYLFPGVEDSAIPKSGVYSLLEKNHSMEYGWTDRYFEAVKAPPQIAEILSIKKGNPVMLANQIAFTKEGACYDYALIWLRSERVRISLSTKPK